MRRIVGFIGAVIVIAVLIAGFMAYFVTNTDPVTNVMYDGLGRPLSASPFFVRFIFGQDRLWAGWLWLIGDMVIFWSGLLAGSSLASWGFQESKTND
jgi:hypothetical protein